MFVDDFTAQFDYLIVLRSPYEFIDEENLEQIINSSFKCGCLVSFLIILLKFKISDLLKSSYGWRQTYQCRLNVTSMWFWFSSRILLICDWSRFQVGRSLILMISSFLWSFIQAAPPNETFFTVGRWSASLFTWNPYCVTGRFAIRYV